MAMFHSEPFVTTCVLLFYILLKFNQLIPLWPIENIYRKAVKPTEFATDTVTQDEDDAKLATYNF